MKNKIIIRISGGMIEGIYTNMEEEIEIDILDEDTDGLDPTEYKERELEHAWLESEIRNMIQIH